MDSLKLDRNLGESITFINKSDQAKLFGVNNPDGLLVIITNRNKNTPKNMEINKKIATIDFSKNNFITNPDIPIPSIDSIKNSTFDFVSIEKQPSFPGGLQAFYKYLSSNIKYPRVDQRNKTQGKVFLSFVVEKDGEITNVAIMRGLSETIDAEAVRVVSGSPKWNPGIQYGVPVRVKYNINVNFNLN